VLRVNAALTIALVRRRCGCLASRGLAMIADLARLTWTFLWLSVDRIGGGLGVVPGDGAAGRAPRLGHAAGVIDGYALSQLTPGPSMLLAVFVGYRAHGARGALLAGTACFPPVLAPHRRESRRTGRRIRERPWAQVAERHDPDRDRSHARRLHARARGNPTACRRWVIAILRGLALVDGTGARHRARAGRRAGWLAAL